MTALELELIAQAIAAQCSMKTEFDGDDCQLSGYEIEFEEVVYLINCDVVVHYPQRGCISRSEPPYERQATSYDILYLDVTKCLPDYQVDLNTNKHISAIERQMRIYEA